MTFRLSFKTDHGVLGRTATDRGAEIARILRVVANEAEAGLTHGPVKDTQGRKIGEWSYKHGLFDDVVGDVMVDALRKRA